MAKIRLLRTIFNLISLSNSLVLVRLLTALRSRNSSSDLGWDDLTLCPKLRIATTTVSCPARLQEAVGGPLDAWIAYLSKTCLRVLNALSYDFSTSSECIACLRYHDHTIVVAVNIMFSLARANWVMRALEKLGTRRWMNRLLYGQEDKILWIGSEGDDDDDIPTEAYLNEASE
ncbi:hypothetical protein PanWU01x14_342360 [Parasponia andersonii]|uniref:Uncharacterized protein n=1 Tax=Parasponia andersonii TaxID=3476 RepID=A0A2P5ADQ5_PARAD|nr:hypothetical protein PanWU01x14_342360 [Parasponia andersonii]